MYTYLFIYLFIFYIYIYLHNKCFLCTYAYFINKLFLPKTHISSGKSHPSEFWTSAVAARPDGEEVLEVSEAAEAGGTCLHV